MDILEIHAYDWTIQNEEDFTHIHCWGFDENSEPYLLRILDFPINYYLELPFNSNNLTNESISKILNEIFKEYTPNDFEVEYKKRLYYYNQDKLYPYLNIVFNSLFHFKKCLNKLRYNKDYNKNYKFVEEEINIVRKLLTLKNIKYSGWFKCQGNKVTENKISDIKNEYIINWTTICSIEKNIITHPGILAFDIESYSDNHRAMPDSLNSKHHAYMISCIYKKYKVPGTIKRYGIIFGKSNNINLENCKIYQVNDELSVIDAFADIIKETKPEIITGYNILGFDYPYLNTRLEMKLKDWPNNISRILNRKTIMENRSWHSDAYGYQMINILRAEGLISVDMLPAIKREYKLDKYDLNTVCSKFINKTKHDVKAKEMFEIYEKCMIDNNNPKNIEEMTKVMAYCIQDSELVIELFEKINCWESLVEMSNIVGITVEEVYTRGQQIRCVSQLYDLGFKENFILNKRSNQGFPYKGATVFEPIPGVYDNIICLDFASLYPSIIQAYNICYSTLVPEHLFDKVKDEDCNIVEIEQETDEDEPNLTGKKILKKDIKKITKKFTFKFYKNNKGLLPRLVENLVNERRNVRKQIELLKKEKGNELLILILDKRQLALKVAANSFYGFLGVHNNGKLPLIEAAMAITFLGRSLIEKVRLYIYEKYQGKLIYGDTDSVMVDIPQIKKSSECTYWGQKLAQEISGIKKGEIDYKGEIVKEDIKGIFPPPLMMEFEKAMRMLLLKKKKYASYLIEDNGEFKREKNQKSLLLRGIVLVRRDNCVFLRELYKKILYMILDKQPIYRAINEIILNIYNLKNNKIDINKLKIIKQLGSNYKSDSALLKVFSDDLKNDGKIMNPGDRLEYVVVKGTSKLRGHNLRLIEQFEEGKEEIDYDYYIDYVLMNPINQLFSVGYKDELSKLKSFYLHSDYKNIYLDDIVLFIQKYSLIDTINYKNFTSYLMSEADKYGIKLYKVPNNCKLNLN